MKAFKYNILIVLMVLAAFTLVIPIGYYALINSKTWYDLYNKIVLEKYNYKIFLKRKLND